VKDLNIIPLPSEITLGNGEFKLNANTKFYLTTYTDSLEKVVNFFNEKIKKSTGYDIVVSEKKLSRNYIYITLSENEDFGNEGYSIDVDSKKIVIRALTCRGIFYGLQTILQLLPPEIESSSLVSSVSWTIPAISIKDKPRFQYRGYMLDVCRHYFSPEFIKKQIDILSMFKINHLHWHLTDDQGWRVEILKYPKLTENSSWRVELNREKYGGYYTQKQIKDIVEYAAQRFITIIPEIEMPGHSLAALSSYPHLSCTGGPFNIPNYWSIEKDIYCAGNEETYEFIENILTEISTLFPGKYIHIGGDEAPKDRWNNCILCQRKISEEKLKDAVQLQSYFIQRVESVVKKLGKKIIGWDEILEGGIAPSATIMSWRGIKGGIEAANSNHNVIMTPYSNLYLDYYQGDKIVEPIVFNRINLLSNVYNYEPIPNEIDPNKIHHILGAQANMWTEFATTPNMVDYLTYPRIIALAELTWTPKEKKEFLSFSRRLKNAYARLDKHSVNYHIPLPEGPLAKSLVFTDSILVPFKNTLDYPMFFTLDGTDPNINSEKYNAPIRILESKTIKIASVTPLGKMSSVVPIIVSKQNLSPSYTGEGNPGFTMKSADGVFLTKKSLNNAQFSGRQIIYDFPNSKSFGNKKQFVHVYEGYFEVQADGIYTFGCDKEMLWINDSLLIDNYEIPHKNLVKTSQVALSKGKHRFKMITNNNAVCGILPEKSINTFWIQSPNNGTMQQIKPELLSH
jgi:hexosaminidase